MYEEFLKEGETLDDLGGGRYVIQRADGYRFTSDAVLLANMCDSGGVFADLGCGSGVISILLASKKKAVKVYGVELEPNAADMAARSVALNGLCDKIEILNADVRDCASAIGKCDKAVCNPPFFKVGSGGVKQRRDLAMARHELFLTFSDVAAAAAALLKQGGYFYCVQKCERLAEVLTTLTQNGLQPKRLTLIHPKAEKTDSFIVKCKKGAEIGLEIEEFTLYEADGSMTAAAKRLYAAEV